MSVDITTMDYSKLFLLLIILVLICVAVMYYRDERGLVEEREVPRDQAEVDRAAREVMAMSQQGRDNAATS